MEKKINNRSISYNTYKALLARSGNECAFPDCNHPLFNNDDLLIAQLCHIEAVSPNGPRYNKRQTTEERNSSKNLVFFCYRHHKETDDINQYTVEKLKEIKSNHEFKFIESKFTANAIMIQQVSEEMKRYWNEVSTNNAIDEYGFRIEVNTKASFSKLIGEVVSALDSMKSALRLIAEDDDNLNNKVIDFLKTLDIDTAKLEAIEYYNNPLEKRFWEYHNIGFPNWIKIITIRLKQIELKFNELYISQNPLDKKLHKALNKTKKDFMKIVSTFNYND